MIDLKELKELSDAGFPEMEKDDLMKMCLDAGLKPHMNAGAEKLQGLLRELIVKKSERKLDQNLIKGLTGFPWKGLQKLVHIRRPEGLKKNKKVHCAWNGNPIAVPYDRPGTSIPWPHFMILRGAQTGSVEIDPKKVFESQPDFEVNYASKHSIEDLGDDPNSKTKFTSVHEYLVSMWDVIEPMTVREKIMILSQLTDGLITRSYVDTKKWTDEDVHSYLASMLNIEE